MRYPYIAIEGNIGAGKTSLAHLIAKKNDARLVLEEFADNPFLPKFYKNRERYSFPLELSFLAERFSQLKKEINPGDLFENKVISDYFISKSLIFSQANLQDDEWNLFSKLYSIIEPTLPKPDLLVFLHLPTDKLLENIRHRGREYEQQITGDYLEEVQTSYMNYIKQHQYLRVLMIDTNELDFVNKEADFLRIDEILQEEYARGINLVQA